MKNSKSITQSSKVLSFGAILSIFMLSNCQKVIKREAAVKDPTESTPIGFKDFEQLNVTMSTLTGVNKKDLNQVMAKLVSQLPSDPNPQTYGASQQAAIAKLAVEYCDRAMRNGTLRAVIYPNLNFSAKVSQALDAKAQNELVQATIKHFFGESGDTQTAENELADLTRDLVAAALHGNPQTGADGTPENTSLNDNTDGTRAVATGVCSAALASTPVTMFSPY